ncbi:uncharacterized protein LOC8273769 isoform X2 [Ricinus communis]|uniref:uncharacterized protein LOC8273769 isoform X2 n=1 Tax=Ricinus communis TaxID=3988 RepID=UPI00201AF5A9|nr:uncharacterized protein LOC8273769 isoform X2 [Ricinus communis]
MNVSDKTISSSSTSNKPPSIPKDENEESYHDKGLNVQNLKKSTATTPAPIKQFMSPTISAASKANPPRKKILAERNDSQDTYPQKTQNFDSKSTQKATNPDSRITSSIEFGDNQENALIDDLSSRPYDPLTNYLSPRPKFLRYKPNRRREILLGQENQVKEGKDDGPLEAKKEIDLPSPCGALAADSTKPNAEQENEESDDSEEEYEELDEERGCWGVRGVVKFFLLMGVLVFSTLYISSMNSPIPSPSVQAVVSVKDGYYMMQDHVYRFVKDLDSGNLFLVDRKGIELSFADVDGIKKEERIEDIKIKEAGIDDEHNGGFVEIQSGEIKTVDESSVGGEDEAMEIVEHEEKGIVDDDLGNVIELQSGEVSDGSDFEIAKTKNFPDLEIAKAGELLDQVATNSELQGQEAVEVLEMPLEIVSNVEKDKEVVYEPIKEDILDGETGGTADITDEAEVTKKERLINHMETKSILKLVIGFSVFSSIIASPVLILHFRKKNRNARKDSDTIPEPCLDSMRAEKCSSLLADKEDSHIEHPITFANFKSLINSLEEDSKQTHESRAPTFELLGELVVGEMSSSLRSCSRKSRVIESEMSSHSVSVEKGIGSKANSTPVQLQSAFSETSTTNFHSFTNEKKILKKEEEEGGGDGDVKKMVTTTTPLRRSSRLRNRAVSPLIVSAGCYI